MVRINIYTGSLQTDTNGNQTVVTKNAGNSFDCVVMFTKPYRRFREVSLKNAQIPIGFYNIRSPLNTLKIKYLILFWLFLIKRLYLLYFR